MDIDRMDPTGCACACPAGGTSQRLPAHWFGRVGEGPRSRLHHVLILVLAVLGLLFTTGAAWGQGTEPGDVLTLPEAVQIALRRNHEVRDADYALDLASEQVSEAWGSVFPRLDWSASYTRNLTPAVSFVPAAFFDPTAGEDEFVRLQFGADNAWNTSINLDQTLFDATAFIGVGAAGRFKGLQQEVARGRRQAVVTRVRTAFYDLLLAQEQLRLIHNSVDRVERSLAETQALNRAGLTSDYDVLRLEVQLANLVPNLRRAENAVRSERRTLALELDLDGADDLSVAGSLAAMDLSDFEANDPANRELLRFAGLEAPELNPDAVENLLMHGLEQRSDVRQMELTESLRRTEMRLEQIEYLPKISLVGNYVITAQQNGSPDFFGQGRERAYTRLLGVQVSVPIFTGLQRDARVDQKRAQLRQAETQTRLATDRARNQIQDLIEEADEARERADGQRLAVRQATRGYEIATAQYGEGIGSQLELTDAEVALRESEFNYAQAVYDFLAARARLDEALGQVPLVDGGTP